MSSFENLSSKLKSITADYIGEHDESDEFIYTDKWSFLPTIFYNIVNVYRRLFGMKQIRPDRRVKRYGRIKAHLFYYITLPMVFITVLLLGTVVINIWTLFETFQYNIPLNSIIVSLLIFGLLRIYYNSWLIFRASSFLRQVERTVDKTNVTARDYQNLRLALEGKGELFNTYFMAEVLDESEKFGYFKINDNQARLIKSKVGYRVNSNRKGVNFIAGMLVMLGRIGTFLGLLATIGKVGDILADMSNIQNEGAEGIARFVTSLSEPLGGMGLAFSSSLFGLSGSLLIGFFLHLSMTPQNSFMENVSRWIDDRIERFDPKELAKKKAESKDENDAVESDNEAVLAKSQPHATNDEMKDWLTGYIYLTTETNKNLQNLVLSLGELGKGMDSVTQELRVISRHQESMLDVSQVMGHSLEKLIDHTQNMYVSIKDVQDLSHMINTAMTSVDISNKHIADRLPEFSDTFSVMQDNTRKYTGALYNELKTLNATHAQSLEMVQNNVTAGNTRKSILSDIDVSVKSFELSYKESQQSNALETTLRNIEVLLDNIDQTQQGANAERQKSNELARMERILARVESSNRELAHAIKSANKSAEPKRSAFSFFSRSNGDSNGNGGYGNGRNGNGSNGNGSNGGDYGEDDV